MILKFLIGNQPVFLKIDNNRKLWFKSDMTNNQFVLFKTLVLDSGQEGLDSEITERVLSCNNCLRNEEEIEHYILNEFTRSPEIVAAGYKYLGKENGNS